VGRRFVYGVLAVLLVAVFVPSGAVALLFSAFFLFVLLVIALPVLLLTGVVELTKPRLVEFDSTASSRVSQGGAVLSLLLLAGIAAVLWRLEVDAHGWPGLIWLSYFHWAIPAAVLLLLAWIYFFAYRPFATAASRRRLPWLLLAGIVVAVVFGVSAVWAGRFREMAALALFYFPLLLFCAGRIAQRLGFATHGFNRWLSIGVLVPFILMGDPAESMKRGYLPFACFLACGLLFLPLGRDRTDDDGGGGALVDPPDRFRAGFPAEFAVGEIDARWKHDYGVWIVREAEGFYALVAAHTAPGCVPDWLPAENRFRCRCHGHEFSRSGLSSAGAAHESLARAHIALAADGQIVVDKSVSFRQEEWARAEAFLRT
jgi:cytochrome b6-f complex iron-sulfur subunit